jgi:hypothetical protein
LAIPALLAEQLDLAKTAGAAIGIGNGWIEYTGLANLPKEAATRLLNDLRQLRSHQPRIQG